MKLPVLSLLLFSSLAAAQGSDFVPPPVGAACRSADACAAGELCRGGLCRRACSRDRDCGGEGWCAFQQLPGQSLAAGLCVDRGAGSICQGDGDCGPGFACLGKSTMDDARLCVSTAPPPPPPPPRKAAPPAPTQPLPEVAPAPPPLDSSGRLRLNQPRPYTRGAIPEGFHVVERPAGKALLATGATMAGASYLLGVVLFALAPDNPVQLVPLVGPFLWGQGRSFNLGTSFQGIALTAVGFSTQVVGLSLAIAGALMKDRWLEPIPLKPRVSVVPGAAGAPAGASLVGTF